MPKSLALQIDFWMGLVCLRDHTIHYRTAGSFGFCVGNKFRREKRNEVEVEVSTPGLPASRPPSLPFARVVVELWYETVLVGPVH